MLNVFLDTTVFRGDARRRSPEFTALGRHSGPYQIQIHTSDISRREFVTHVQQELDAAISAARKALKNLRKVYSDESESEQLKDKVDKIAPDREQLARDSDNWATGAAVEIHSVTGEHGAAVQDSYFAGSAPFSKVKARQDIPDALIYQPIASSRSVPAASIHMHFRRSLRRLASNASHDLCIPVRHFAGMHTPIRPPPKP